MIILTAALFLLSDSHRPRDPLSADGSTRPRDPWVFRCVLDRHPRMVTLALSDEMWVAYDATHCALYKAWKGGVKFDGPVYTTVHGPQPTTRGTSYLDAADGDAWITRAAGAEVPVKPAWRGYRFNGDHVALEYAIVLPDGREIAVQESPEFVLPEQMLDDRRMKELGFTPGRPGFLRNFLARDLPKDVEIQVRVRTDSATAKVVGVVGDARVVLTQERPSASLAVFFEPLPDPAPEPEPKPESKEGAK